MKKRVNFLTNVCLTVCLIGAGQANAGDLLDFLEDQGALTNVDELRSIKKPGETLFEAECRKTFEIKHRWNFGNPNDRYWDAGCWEFVEKQDAKWKWVGDAERRRLAAEKQKREEEKRKREAERKKKEEEKRLAEIERKRREAEAEAKRLAKLRDEAVQRLLINYKAFPLGELEKQLTELSRSVRPEDIKPIVQHFVDTSFQLNLNSGDGDVLDAINGTINRSRIAGIDISLVSAPYIDFLVVAGIDKTREGSEGFDVRISREDFPALTLPRDVSVEALAETLNRLDTQHYVVMHLKPGEVSRDVVKHETIRSRFQSGEQTLPNPAYDRRVLEVQEYMINLSDARRAQSQCSATCYGVGCFVCLAWLGKIKSIRDRHSMAQRNLNSTSRTITKPIYSDYEFKKNTIKVTKSAIADVYVLDALGQIISKRELKQLKSDQFKLIYNLHDRDKNSYQHKQGISSESDVEQFEKQAISLSYGDLIAATRANTDGQFESSIVEVLSPKMPGVVSNNDGEGGLTLTSGELSGDISDHRFDSVVVVLHPNGGLGTGFYVDEETVLTNFHVVEGTKYLEIVLYDGSETFGKVIAKNIALDLALIKVQSRGLPVKWFRTNKLPVGTTVDAIGHPQGLEYSLTRGTISGIRRLPSLYDPGGRSIRFIQTDVAINPGNSGGPLFIGDEVVGVNDWKLADTDLEGLAFSIHISEVKKFLANHGM